MPRKVLNLLLGASLASLTAACARQVEPASTSEVDKQGADKQAADKQAADKQATADQTQGAPAPANAPIAAMAAPGTKTDGASCLSAEECTSGICEGQGCDDAHPGTCQPTKRPCTYDLQPFCGCDRVGFDAGGNCPSRRYAAKGKCPG